jgi:hypothetical protein
MDRVRHLRRAPRAGHYMQGLPSMWPGASKMKALLPTRSAPDTADICRLPRILVLETNLRTLSFRGFRLPARVRFCHRRWSSSAPEGAVPSRNAAISSGARPPRTRVMGNRLFDYYSHLTTTPIGRGSYTGLGPTPAPARDGDLKAGPWAGFRTSATISPSLPPLPEPAGYPLGDPKGPVREYQRDVLGELAKKPNKGTAQVLELSPRSLVGSCPVWHPLVG